MTRARVRSLCLLAFVLVTGLVLLWTRPWRTMPGPKQWLLVSAPVFETRITSTGLVRTFCFTLTNIGPRTIEPKLFWFECRARTGLSVIAVEYNPQALAPLPSRAVSRVTQDLPQGIS